MDITGVVDSPATLGGDATAKETPEGSPGTGEVAPDAPQGAENQAGGSQDPSESGSVDGQSVRQRGPSKLDTIRDLRAKLREQRSYWESEMGTVKSQMEELKNLMQSGQSGPKPRKTLWENPDDWFDDKLGTHMSDLERRIVSKIEKRDSESQADYQQRLEVSEAAKFIKSQKGMTEDDIQEIREILAENPKWAQLDPMDQAEFALARWQKGHGITDKSDAKARAATSGGSGHASEGGAKIWTESEMEREISLLPRDPKNWSDENKKRFDYLDTEFKRAVSEGRVKK